MARQHLGQQDQQGDQGVGKRPGLPRAPAKIEHGVGMAHNPRYPEAPPVPERVLINPRITPLSEVTIRGWEGCLSVPGLRGEVARWASIRLQWRDPWGRSHDETCSGFEARVLQHECDHLDGVLFPDRLHAPTAFGFEDELEAAGLLP